MVIGTSTDLYAAAVAQPGSVRARVRAAIVGTVALALLLLGVPLAGSLHYVFRGQAETRLEGEASRVLVSVPDDAIGRTPLPAPRDPHTRVGVYSASGDRLAGSGPLRDSAARRAGARRGEVRDIV